jgi:hypothetical protein
MRKSPASNSSVWRNSPGTPADSSKVRGLWLAFRVPDRHRPGLVHRDLRCRLAGRYHPLAPALSHQESPGRLQHSLDGARHSPILEPVYGASALVPHQLESVSDEQSGLDR